MKEENRKAPKLRFPGFDGDWEQRKLSDLMEFSNGFNGSSELYGKGIPYISVMDILNNYVITYDCIRGKVKLDEKTLSRFAVDYGDVLFQRSSENVEDAGSSNVYVGEKTVAFGGFVIRGKKQSDYDVHFMKNELDSTAVRKQITSKAQGAQHINVSQETLTGVIISTPSKEEQQLIGHLFNSMNNTITLHQRKLDQIKEYKKGMLQKMFPKKGEHVPEVRFPGFEGDWEERKFSKFTRDVGRRNKDNLKLEPYAVTNDRGFIRQADAHDEFGYMKNVDRKAYNIVPPKSFAYNPARINVGSIGYYDGKDSVIVSSLYEVFQTDDSVDDRFLWHWFKSDFFPKWIEKLQEGSVRFYFYYDKLCECHMLMPTIDEQRKISEYIDNIDSIISLHQQKLDEMKEYKKGLLQQMFV